MREEADNGLPQTILHVIDALNYGGAQKLLLLLAQWTPQKLYRTLICSLQENEELKDQFESLNVPVFCFHRPRPSISRPHLFWTYFFRNIRDIMRICRQEKVDVIQCHLSDAEFIGILAARLTGIPRILTTIHYPDLLPTRRIGDFRNFLRWLYTKIIYKWVDCIIAVSEDVSQKLQELFDQKPPKIRVMVNRIDVQSFATTPPSEDLRKSLGLRPENQILTTVARLMPPKGHAYLLEAMHQLVPKFESLKLLLVGDGDLRQPLQEKCAALGLMEHTLFIGSRRDIPAILALTDIFILPSLWEGTSLALLEAMASCKPIVATDIPGNRSVLQHQKNSRLVPPGNAAALADAIAFLLKHPDVGHKLAQNAYELARSRFDIRQSIAELENLWATPCIDNTFHESAKKKSAMFGS
jgi:glycosyltransferase involved in cell wall biosynthesis